MKTVNYLGHTVLLEPLLKKKPVVFDCGSNAGEFAEWMNERLNARVYGYEPDPRLFSKLSSRKNSEITFFQMAIAGTAGAAELHLGESQCSSLCFSENGGGGQSETVETTTLEAELSRLGVEQVDLLKLDIEGAELEVLQTTPEHVLRRIGQITVEFHDFLRPSDVPAIRKTIARMRSLGFLVLFFSTRTYGDVLFVNRAVISLPAWQRMSVLATAKYLAGIRRTLARCLVRS